MINSNEFIVEYTEEVYPSYRWFEKSDIIKNILKNKLLKVRKLLEIFEKEKNSLLIIAV